MSYDFSLQLPCYRTMPLETFTPMSGFFECLQLHNMCSIDHININASVMQLWLWLFAQGKKFLMGLTDSEAQ